MEFTFDSLPWHIVFAPGAINRLPTELERLGFSHALVLSTPEQADHAMLVCGLLGDKACGKFTDAQMHVPVTTIAKAASLATELEADCTVAIGGGSTTGLGKALALKSGLPNIAIPTTYAGSEMTNVWGMTDAGRKQTGRDNIVVPELTIYDPELTLGLPIEISGPSGLNALAQAIVNVTAAAPNPIITALAIDAIATLSRSLPIVIREPNNLSARSDALYGACLAGGVLGLGITGLHHRMCHTLGGAYDTPHADTHAILLAYSVAFNEDAVPDATARIARAMQVDDAALGIFDLMHQVCPKKQLSELNIKEGDLDRVAAITVESPIANPKPVTVEDVRRLFDDAFFGRPPKSGS